MYNIWFHPLRTFPGPWYTKASRIWYVLRVFQGCHKHEIKSLHDQYGLVVRIAPDELSFIDPEAWHGIYGKIVSFKPSYGHGEKLTSCNVEGSAVHNNESHPMEKDEGFFATAFGDSETLVSISYLDLFIQYLSDYWKPGGRK